ncbi:ABC transporter permease, partial [Stutzerimonas balearica]|uniref:ABC transporter permease n=1 Tax=Stutzerimonas balearica TaxID=74829 RepID=UPI0032B21B38
MPITLQPRGAESRAMLWLSPLLAALLTLASGALLFALLGHPPLQTLKVLLLDPVSDLYGVSELLVKALPILLCALGLAVVYQARIWNIGAEGQLLIGALAGSALAVHITDWDSRLALLLTLLLGILGGAAWAGLCAWLKTAFNANEILTSIMLNYIALNLLLFAVHGPLKDPDGYNFPESAMFGDATRLPELIDGLRVHAGFWFALLALVAVWVLLHRSFLGFQIKVLGLDRKAAGFVGFRDSRLVWIALLISGGTALSALLGYGLKPDLHCEVENVEDIHTVIAGVAERYDISDIPLLCPVTVDPRIPSFFRRVAGFFREGLTPTLLFGGDVGPWNHAGPTV